MTVKDGFSLLLNLKLPALLGVLHLVQHVGSAAGAGQHVVGICKRLVILKVQQGRTSDGMVHVKHRQTDRQTDRQTRGSSVEGEQLDLPNNRPSHWPKHSQALNCQKQGDATIETGGSGELSAISQDMSLMKDDLLS